MDIKMKRFLIWISLLCISLTGCENGVTNTDGPHSGQKQIAVTTADPGRHSKNYDKITEAFAEYRLRQDAIQLKFSPSEALDDFFSKNGWKAIKKISVLKINSCDIINTDKTDIIMQVYVEDQMRSYHYFLPFLYDSQSFHLNEKSVFAYNDLLHYELVDLDGDKQNEILAEYLLTHNGTDHIIHIFKCDSYENYQEILYKSVNEFMHKLKYGFCDDVPKELWLEDIKTYINTEKKRRVAKKIKYIYTLKNGKYVIKSRKILEKSDRKDFYDWSLG